MLAWLPLDLAHNYRLLFNYSASHFQFMIKTNTVPWSVKVLRWTALDQSTAVPSAYWPGWPKQMQFCFVSNQNLQTKYKENIDQESSISILKCLQGSIFIILSVYFANRLEVNHALWAHHAVCLIPTEKVPDFTNLENVLKLSIFHLLYNSE